MQEYIDYKKAAERHLETCRQLKGVVNALQAAASLNPADQQRADEILYNIYYLSGYIIECTVSYCILKFINFGSIKKTAGLTYVKQLKFYHMNKAKKNYGVSYSYNDLGDTYLGYRCRWAIYCKGHRLAENLRFFTIEAGLTRLKIYGIDLPIKDAVVKQMLDAWGAETRYIPPAICVGNKGKILEFFNLAEHIHINLLKTAHYF